jgi:hypothetical protein
VREWRRGARLARALDGIEKPPQLGRACDRKRRAIFIVTSERDRLKKRGTFVPSSSSERSLITKTITLWRARLPQQVSPFKFLKVILEAPPGFEPGMEVLQI